MTNATDVEEERTHRERVITRAIVGVLLVVLVGVIVNAALGDGTDPGEERFVATVRRDNPQLSVASASDDDLLSAALRSCGPDGLSSGDEVWLESLDVDPVAFARTAESICPSR